MTKTRLKKEFTVSVAEAAEVLGVSLSTAYAQAANGSIGDVRVLKIGRRLRVPTADLLRAVGDEAS